MPQTLPFSGAGRWSMKTIAVLSRMRNQPNTMRRDFVKNCRWNSESQTECRAFCRAVVGLPTNLRLYSLFIRTRTFLFPPQLSLSKDMSRLIANAHYYGPESLWNALNPTFLGGTHNENNFRCCYADICLVRALDTFEPSLITSITRQS